MRPIHRRREHWSIYCLPSFLLLVCLFHFDPGVFNPARFVVYRGGTPKRLRELLVALFTVTVSIYLHAWSIDVERAAWLVDHVLYTFFPEEAVSNNLVWNLRPYPYVHLVQMLRSFALERIYQMSVLIASFLELNNSQKGEVKAEHLTTL